MQVVLSEHRVEVKQRDAVSLVDEAGWRSLTYPSACTLWNLNLTLAMAGLSLACCLLLTLDMPSTQYSIHVKGRTTCLQ